MPKFLESKLKREYPNNPSAVYGTLNALGAMHGNKETAKGRAMQKKHDAKASFTGKQAKNLKTSVTRQMHPHSLKNLTAPKFTKRKAGGDTESHVYGKR